MMFFASAVLEGATKEAARQIRTGQVQESADPLAAFQAELCGSMVGIIDCSKVVFNVKTFSSFSAVSMPIEVDEEGEVVNAGFLPGGSRSEEHTSELQSLMRISYAVFCLKKKTNEDNK